MVADHLDDIISWLVDGARSAQEPDAVLDQLCDRLLAAGLPLWRAGVFVSTPHPELFGRSFVWRHGRGVVVTGASFTITNREEFQTSPLSEVIATGKRLRHRLSETPAGRSIFLDDMRAEGITDYIAFPLVSTDGSVDMASWTTKLPSGFSDADVEKLERIMPAFTRVAEVRKLNRLATNLLNTYVGHRTGAKILAGQIRRGHTEVLHAVIWLSDLRGFTALSDRIPPILVVDLLNRYFDCQVPAIVEHGGEVLKFMGDGLLAIFPIADDGSDERAVCSSAVAAARTAREAVRSLRYSALGGPTEDVRFGLALHVGEVLYGNIGGSDRLDFTCIGPAVNLAARLEKLAGKLGRTIVASAEFAKHLPDDWHDIGEFSVAGISKAQRVFGLKDEGAAGASAAAN
jgi:adenylate cyclase